MAGAVSARAEPLPPFERVVAQFEAVGFNSEFPEFNKGRENRISRWEGPVRMRIDAPIPKHMTRIVDELRDLTGLYIVWTNTLPANVVVNLRGPMGCWFRSKPNGPMYVTARPRHENLDHCIAEEMLQALGPDNDACEFRPSIFCEADGHLVTYTPADRMIIRAYHDWRLRDLMPREEAMPIARQILRELYDAEVAG